MKIKRVPPLRARFAVKMAKLCLVCLLAAPAFGGIPVQWSVDTFRLKPLVYNCYHGETLDLASALTAYGEPVALTGKTAHLYWATNATATAWWVTNATVSSSANITNILAATFSGAYDTGADVTYGFIGIDGENYRASFELHFRPSPGFSPSALPAPTETLDLSRYTILNAPYYTKSEVDDATNATLAAAKQYTDEHGGGGVSRATVTNIAEAVVAPATNAVASVLMAELSSASTASTNFTLAQCEHIAQAATNYTDSATNATLAAAKADASAKYLPLTGGTISGSLAQGVNCTTEGGYASHAEGSGTTVSSYASHAEGSGTTASSYASHAEGSGTTASGYVSHAEGNGTTASGEYSHAEGSGTTASGRYSYACGAMSISSNDYSFTWSHNSGFYYGSHGDGTFNINPLGGLAGFYIGETNFVGHVTNIVNGMVTNAVTDAMLSNVTHTAYFTNIVDGAVSNIVVTAVVGTAMNELLGSNWQTKYGGGVAGVIAAIFAALALLHKKKIATLKCGDLEVGVSAVSGAPAGQSDVSPLFTSANTSLTGTIKDCGGVQHDSDGYFIETEV